MRTWRMVRRLAFGAAILAAVCITSGSGAPAVPAQKPTAASPATTQWKHDWVNSAVFYEVFVRSFADSNGDGIGDLPGLISKLDYLNDGDPKTTTDLGVDALWLMPVFVSPSYHGYDATDYDHINPAYGTNEDFARLCREAHRRGLRVILDLVLNHTSDQHPWFVASASSPKSDKRDWYVWRPDNPGWTQPWGRNPTWHEKNGAFYYGIFWGGMPDLNFRSPQVRAEMKRIAKEWLDRGADGFRLDATRHLIEAGGGAAQNDSPETHAFLSEFAGFVRSVKPEAILVGENWTDTDTIATYFGKADKVKGGDQLPMNFNFPLAGAIVDGVRKGDAQGLASTIREMQKTYPPGVIDAPFLTNHDMVRVATQLGGDPALLRSAAAVLLTLPGAPFLYYGEEIGLANGPGEDDEFKRTPMPWDATSRGGFTTGKPWFAFAPGQEKINVAAETNDPNSLLASYRALVHARRLSEALRLGTLELLSSPGAALAFTRRTDRQSVLVLHNLGAASATLGPYGSADRAPEPIFVSPGIAAPARAAAGWTITLPPHASGIWEMESGRKPSWARASRP